jgi:hypothetical protein
MKQVSNTEFLHICPIHLLVLNLLVDSYVSEDRYFEIKYLSRLFPHLATLVKAAERTTKGWTVPKHKLDVSDKAMLDPDFDTRSAVFLAKRVGLPLERDNQGQFVIYTGVYDLAYMDTEMDAVLDDITVISREDIQKAIG